MQTKTGIVYSRTVNMVSIPKKFQRRNPYLNNAKTPIVLMGVSCLERLHTACNIAQLGIIFLHLVKEVSVKIFLVIVLNQVIGDALQRFHEVAFPLIQHTER